MRVAIATAHLSEASAGFAAAVPGLVRALLRQPGCEAVELIGVRDPRAPEAWRAWGNGYVKPQRQLGPLAFGWAPGMNRSLEATRPDLVHTQGLWMYPSLASLRWHRRTGRPHMISPHGMLDAWAVGRARLKKQLVSWWFETEHLRSAACLHALNEAEANAIRSYGLRNPICIIPNGVDLPESGSSEAKARGGRMLLFLGRLDPKKGLRELLHAWSMVADEAGRAGWRLQLSGWGSPDYVRGLEQLVTGLDLQRSVQFTGPLHGDAKAAAFRSASAFILPSHSEGMPMAVLEAWSHGLPVLITNACNLPEGFAAGAALRIGVVPCAIASGLRELFAMEQSSSSLMGGRGRMLVEEQFTWPNIGTRMAEVYAWVLGGGAPPACVVTD
jgi:poly(glycerol-phosphate) alpha-glucosyltransferase